MRIVGGIHRSRKLLPPRDAVTTRPITDRVKTSLFDRLAARGLLDGGSALDMFAGTGSLGLEALSRGSDYCTFIERDRDARKRLEINIETLRLGDEATVMGVDALSAAWINLLGHKPLSLIFCDPPYRMTQNEHDRQRVMAQVQRLAAASEPGAVLVVRTDNHTPLAGSDGWDGPDLLDYGSMHVHWYQCAG
jgi:16S rRNA (guanine(966)-N(2))-methyltransferase RsmD